MRKKLALGLAGVMLATSLSGCGGASSKYLLDEKYSKYVKLCEYKGVEATKVTFDVTKEEIQEQIEEKLYDYVTYDVVDNRGIIEGDYVVIDYEATLDGEKMEDYSFEDEELHVGEGFIYPEVEEALVGMKTGEEKSVDVILTEDFAEEKDVGKKIAVKVKVDEISVENLPEYNKKFLEDYTDFESMEEYEESVKQELLQEKEDEYSYAAYEELLTYIVENSKFDGYPKELYEKCEEAYASSNEFYASLYGMELDEYLENIGLDEATQKQEIEYNVNYELVIGAIAQAENIDCTKEEVEQYIEEIYADYGYESKDELLEDYTEEEIGYDLIYQKVLDFLYENAKFNEITEEEYLEEHADEYGDFFDMEDVEGGEFEEDDNDENVSEELDLKDIDEMDEEDLSVEVEDGSSQETKE